MLGKILQDIQEHPAEYESRSEILKRRKVESWRVDFPDFAFN